MQDVDVVRQEVEIPPRGEQHIFQNSVFNIGFMLAGHASVPGLIREKRHARVPEVLSVTLRVLGL